MAPTPPPPSSWSFPPLEELPADHDMVAVGADLEPGTLLEAYRAGFFPMPIGRRKLGWFHPVERGMVPLDGLVVSRSLRRSRRRYRLTVNAAFDQVIRACADPGRPMGWIDHRVIAAYTRLHLLGWAHSVEAWDDEGLAGGLYGVSVGGLFAGESMFHRRVDASKVALLHLVDLLGPGSGRLLDVQWVTPHLASLGAVGIPRSDYCRRLTYALTREPPPELSRAAPTPDDYR
ncbi:MAG: leucyl/phenylalanyl-tRNA--protein transferase [Acidimicrobiales bacterium]